MESQEQKTPEQIAAEQKLQSDIQLAAEQKAKEEQEAKEAEAAAALEEKKQKAGELHFVHEGRVFVPVFHRVTVPGLGERTALEICVDEESQAYLVQVESPAITEIL